MFIDLGAAFLSWRAAEIFARLDAGFVAQLDDGLGKMLHEVEDPLLRCRLAEVLGREWRSCWALLLGLS